MDGFDHRANNDALDPHSRPLRRPPVDYVSAVVTDALEPDPGSKIGRLNISAPGLGKTTVSS